MGCSAICSSFLRYFLGGYRRNITVFEIWPFLFLLSGKILNFTDEKKVYLKGASTVRLAMKKWKKDVIHVETLLAWTRYGCMNVSCRPYGIDIFPKGRCGPWSHKHNTLKHYAAVYKNQNQLFFGRISAEMNLKKTLLIYYWYQSSAYKIDFLFFLSEIPLLFQ